MTNPDNFVAHRQAMVRLSRARPALTAAWRITGDDKYADTPRSTCARGSSTRRRG